ncbi:MAG: hypothetical protein IAE87_17370 [Rhodobacteraceae bacterium]|jgi:hypothetical protein|nr:hypothetical protein [Paracoccaceae bacterium]
MNSLPFLALAAVASVYAVATDRLEEQFAVLSAPGIVAYEASPNLAVYDMEMLAADDQPYDQAHCMMHAAMAENLSHDFAEERVEARVSDEGLVMELWASEVMGTWTILHKGADGVSCVVTSGTGWADDAAPDQVFASADLAS